MTQRLQTYIAHFDLDSFFVSVEVINNPSLKGKAVIVGGSFEKGVVTTCSYEARQFGVKSAMPMKQAMQLCPQAIVVQGTRGEYSRYSKWVTDIIAAAAPAFQKASIDEFYIDLTGMDAYFNPFEWAKQLRLQIIQQTGLPISFGLASSKLVAKIATDEAKPNGCLFIQPGMEQHFLALLPIGKFPGVGKAAQQKLQNLGVYCIGDILHFSPQQLQSSLGRWAEELYLKAQGIDDSPVISNHETKSISTENTFHEPVSDTDFLVSELVRMAEKVAFQLRQNHFFTGCITVKMRFPNFDTITKQASIAYTFDDSQIIASVQALFHQMYRQGMLVRLIGVRLSHLMGHQSLQTNLFTDTEKIKKLYTAIDSVKTQYGKLLLQRARAVKKGD